MTFPAPSLEHVCDLEVTVGTPIDLGTMPSGRRRIIPITGGTIRGPRMQGRVLSAGADFQLILGGGTHAHLDARYAIEMDDGALIWVHNTALRVASAEDSERIANGLPVDPERVYFRCQPRMETAAPAWSWLNDCQFIGAGARAPLGVSLSYYRVV
jgi:hypothetical protein